VHFSLCGGSWWVVSADRWLSDRLRACSAPPVPPTSYCCTAKSVTMDQQSRVVQAVAVLQGRIAPVGTDAQIQPYVGASTRVVELHGRTIIPGLIDSHIHAIRQGLTWDDEVHW
jgi:adenine deaminase